MAEELESWIAPVRRGVRTGAPILPRDMGEHEDFERTVTIIRFDQGQKTGWAVFNIWREAMERADYPILGNVATWSAGWFSGSEKENVDQMVSLVEAWSDSSHVGYEDFILLRLTGGRELLSPVRIAARFQDRMDVQGRVLDPPQSPSLVMSTVTDDRLRQWGFWASLPGTDNSHARDAVRHCITRAKSLKEAWRKEAEEDGAEGA